MFGGGGKKWVGGCRGGAIESGIAIGRGRLVVGAGGIIAVQEEPNDNSDDQYDDRNNVKKLAVFHIE